MELADEKCIAVTSESPSVTDAEMDQLRLQLTAWSLIVEDGMRKLRNEFKFNNFLQALVFANKVAYLAETEGHYPMTIIQRGKVTLTWWTQKLHSLHYNDFIMAAKTDRVYMATDLSKITG